MKFKILILFFIFIHMKLFALTTININSQTQKINISPYAEQISTQKEQYSYADIQKQNFIAVSKNSISEGYTRDDVWVRFKIKNTDKQDFKGYIEFPVPWVDLMELYTTRENKVIKKTFGATVPFVDREVNSRSFFVSVNIKSNEEVMYYLRINTVDSVVVAPYLYSEKKAEEKKLFNATFSGMIIGVLVIMFFYNLFIYSTLRDLNYVYYAFYIGSVLFHLGFFYGHNAQFFWNKSPEITKDYLAFGVANLYFWGLVFSRRFLDSKKNMPKLDIYLKGLMYIFLIEAILSFFIDQMTIINIIILSVIIYTNLMIISSFVAWRKNIAGSGYFLIAWLLYSITITSAASTVQGYIDFNYILYELYGMSFLFDITLLSFALAKKIEFIKSEKEKSDKLTIEKNNMLFQQNKLISMGEMMRNIAHQWRQPLSSINNSVTLMDKKLQNNLSLQEDLDSIEITVQYMSKTIDDFQDFYKQDKKKSNFHIQDIINKSIHIVNSGFKNSRITIHNDNSNFNLFNYPNELQQVFLVILNNARYAIEQSEITDGTVEIKTKLIKANEQLCIEIYNNGGNIKDEIIDKIFEPYFTTKHKSQGTGLGLYISKMIIEQNMNGKLLVKNTNNGVCFQIILNGGGNLDE